MKPSNDERSLLATVTSLVSFRRVRDVLDSAFWLTPALCVAASIGIALGLIALDHQLPSAPGVAVYPGSPAGALSILSSIITAMITFTGLVFSITILVLQLTSGQFSPRVLRMFLGDHTIQFSLGLFMATFVYAMVVQREVGGPSAGAGAVPRIAVTGAFVFVLGSVVMFIAYISHIANLIRVATIIATIADESRDLLDREYPIVSRDSSTSDQRELLISLQQQPGWTVSSIRPGVMVSVNESRLVELAARTDGVFALVPRVGDFVPGGAPLVRIFGSDPPDRDALADRVRAAIALDIERTMEQDLAFGFRQLIDIAERALSPAVNDPTTACQVIDALHDLLRRLAVRPPISTVVYHAGRDADGADDFGADDDDPQVRLIVPRYQFSDLLTLAVGEIWHYGAGAAQIPGRFTIMLTDLAAAALPIHRPAVDDWQRRIRADRTDAAR
ncbi:MAG: DUF2254 domain-containing protein [Nakamurella sp.]